MDSDGCGPGVTLPRSYRRSGDNVTPQSQPSDHRPSTAKVPKRIIRSYPQNPSPDRSVPDHLQPSILRKVDYDIVPQRGPTILEEFGIDAERLTPPRATVRLGAASRWLRRNARRRR